jgi:hypothetical protein
MLNRPASVLLFWVAGPALTFASGACATPPRPQPPQEAQLLRAISPPEGLAPPQYLPASARAILRGRMASHAQDMGALMSAIMVLHYDDIQQRANDIALDARFARPMTGDASELNSALPERFFVLQEELRTRAGALAGVAARKNALAVADAYGRLSETCVKCHATYREAATPTAAAESAGTNRK